MRTGTHDETRTRDHYCIMEGADWNGRRLRQVDIYREILQGREGIQHPETIANEIDFTPRINIPRALSLLPIS